MAMQILILGAAGRDFHNFNTVYRDNPAFNVVAFTATQIPNIDDRRYPAELAGSLYPDGIPILPESDMEELVKSHRIDNVVFSYSDVSHEYVMHMASRVLAAGANFELLGPKQTLISSNVPIVSVCASRTGSGKSPASRRIASILESSGKKVVVVRHPMPYGDLVKQAVQRFETFEDLDKHDVTIEEREEYEPHLLAGRIVYAGVDYEQILRSAEREADIVIWDGGNNDLPFYKPDIHIVVVDPHRADHTNRYHPGETNVRMADVVIISKVDTASLADIETARSIVFELNDSAAVVEAAGPIFVEEGANIRGKRVLVIEDGPTLTHGEMAYGAGFVAARRYGAGEIVDPRPYAVGSIKATFEKYPTTGNVLPAMGYGKIQTEELAETIRNTEADLVLIATPIDLRHLVEFDKPAFRVRYEMVEIGEPTLKSLLDPVLFSLPMVEAN